MTFDVGALVRARGREWVVQPASQPDFLMLRPLGGEEDQITGVCTLFEAVESASFPLPDPQTQQGNHLACALLRDALRLGFRCGAGPFRALARVAVEPRPYQLVPLLLALKLDPVRLLIADDVGVGKTVEACLIAREMLDRAEIDRLAVLCPPHLAEQWQRALRDQFHIQAELVLASTAARLETDGISLFERHPFTVVSTDYIKSERRRQEFLRTCPELVIVDEAHTCAASGRTAQHRHQLLRELTDPSRDGAAKRHLILVTATPHSGKEDAFRSLLGLLDRQLDELPDDIAGDANLKHRERLARHFVQRRRGDIKAYLDSQTYFPERLTSTSTYHFSTAYKAFLHSVLDFCAQQIAEPAIDRRRRRLRWWSTLALLRAVSSSPAAALATLRNRNALTELGAEQLIDEEASRLVLDPEECGVEGNDLTLGSQTEDDAEQQRALQALATQAQALRGKDDHKLSGLLQRLLTMLEAELQPIVFCRFIATVDYLVEELRPKLAKQGVQIVGVSGQLPPAEREDRIDQLGLAPRRVLVCTDCLSEGINLQQHFNAVIHYDLAWNPTRHEQREGRVDRYGQPSAEVRILTYHGADNPVDAFVIDVLLKKHHQIQASLGVSVFTAVSSEQLQVALYQRLFARGDMSRQLDLFESAALITPADELAWTNAVEREKQSRTKYAQLGLLKAVNQEVGAELEAVRKSLGDHRTVASFVQRALPLLAVPVQPLPGETGVCLLDFREASAAVRDACRCEDRIRAVFEPGPQRGVQLLTRTHPLVDGLARHLLEDALDPHGQGPARRCGAIRTHAVQVRTTLLLLRLRFHILAQDRQRQSRPLLAEDLLAAAFTGPADQAQWLDEDAVEALFAAEPAGNIAHDLAQDLLSRSLARHHQLLPHLQALGHERGEQLRQSHTRVRRAARVEDKSLTVQTHAPPDILGIFLYLPAGGLS